MKNKNNNKYDADASTFQQQQQRHNILPFRFLNNNWVLFTELEQIELRIMEKGKRNHIVKPELNV